MYVWTVCYSDSNVGTLASTMAGLSLSHSTQPPGPPDPRQSTGMPHCPTGLPGQPGPAAFLARIQQALARPQVPCQPPYPSVPSVPEGMFHQFGSTTVTSTCVGAVQCIVSRVSDQNGASLLLLRSMWWLQWLDPLSRECRILGCQEQILCRPPELDFEGHTSGPYLLSCLLLEWAGL